MKLRRFNATGIKRMVEFLDSPMQDLPQPWSEDLLSNPQTSEPVTPEINIEGRNFNSRFEAAEYLHECLSDKGIPDLEHDKGLWSWLALFYFDQFCPPGKDGMRKLGEKARWIPEVTNYRNYYRHLLAGPYRIYHAHGDNPARALALLYGPLHQPGDIVEQLASRQELVTNKSIVEAATLLYYDPKTNKAKRGAAGRGPGSARRLADIFNQFDVTWDLYSMDSRDLLEILPTEFDRFRPGTV